MSAYSVIAFILHIILLLPFIRTFSTHTLLLFPSPKIFRVVSFDLTLQGATVLKATARISVFSVLYRPRLALLFM
jgi:hypothetical protein